MKAVDWNAPAKLIERDDSGSERDYDFHERAAGKLGELVGTVAAMTAHERARMVIDAGAQGTFNVAAIVELATRPDFPGYSSSPSGEGLIGCESPTHP